MTALTLRALFMTERTHRIDARRAPCRPKRSEPAARQEQRRGEENGPWVTLRNAEQNTFDEPGEREGSGDTARYSNPHRHEGFSQDHRDHCWASSSQRHANADLRHS